MSKKHVQLLKNSPNFGIHGTNQKRLNELITTKKFTHSYYVLKQNMIKNHDFYNRFKASVFDATQISTAKIKYNQKTHKISINNQPGILLLFEKENGQLLTSYNEDKVRLSNFKNKQGELVTHETLPVNQGYFGKDEIKFIPIKFNKNDLNELNKRIKKKFPNPTKIGQEIYGIERLASIELAEIMEEKIIKKLKEMQKVKK